MARLYFIRHGETDWNREGRVGEYDHEMNEHGCEQVRDAAGSLASLVGSEVAALPFVVSPKRRTRRSAEIIRRELGLPPGAYAIEKRLTEVSYGYWGGLTWAEVQVKFLTGSPQPDRWNLMPPGGESYAMAMDRIAGWLSGIRNDTCVISHGGVARVMMVQCGGATTDYASHCPVWQGRVLVFEEGSMRWVPDQPA